MWDCMPLEVIVIATMIISVYVLGYTILMLPFGSAGSGYTILSAMTLTQSSLYDISFQEML